MPYRFMNLMELARFLNMDQRRLERMAKSGEIPCQKVGGQLRFNRAEVTEWLQQHMPTLTDRVKLASMEAGISAHREINPDELIVSYLIQPQAVVPDLSARTKNSVLKELVALAQETGRVWDSESLLDALLKREELCSTAMEKGVALPHPRRPLPYAIAEPVLVVARTTSGIGFGAPDGRLTSLFFMTSSQDDRHHLHIIARLCRMLHDDQFVESLHEAETVDEMVVLIQEREQAVIADTL